jgi:hypothetical protein
MSDSRTSYPKVKPRKLVVVLNIPIVFLQALLGALSLGLSWLLDRDYYNWHKQEHFQSSPTTARDGK